MNRYKASYLQLNWYFDLGGLLCRKESNIGG